MTYFEDATFEQVKELHHLASYASGRRNWGWLLEWTEGKHERFISTVEGGNEVSATAENVIKVYKSAAEWKNFFIHPR